MLRNAIGDVCRRAYTCTCILRVSKLTSVPGLCSKLRPFHTASLLRDKEQYLHKVKQPPLEKLSQEPVAEGTENEITIDLEGLSEAGITIPTQETHSMLVNGVRYDELPIAHIKATKNNTIVTITDYKGVLIARSSCGVEGFKNAKKSTNVAAQATGITVGQRAVKKGIENVRVVLQSFGAGRLPSIKGLQIAGLNIVSISDKTYFSHSGLRPQKIRRM